MRGYTITLGLTAVGLCFAASDERAKVSLGLQNARKEYKADLGKALAEYNRAVTLAAEGQNKRLKELQQAETKAGNLDAALAAREELEALGTDGPLVLAEARDPLAPKGKWVAGTWVITHHPNRATRTYVIRSDGKVTFPEEQRNGQLRRVGGSFTLDFGDGKLERVTFAGGRIFTENFDPKGNFEKNLPAQVGVGVLKK